MRKLSKKQLHSLIKRNVLYISGAFMISSIEEDISCQVMEYELIKNSKNKTIGWAIIWKVSVYSEPMDMYFNFVDNSDEKTITLIGVFVKKEYRCQGLASKAINRVLTTYKKNPHFCKKETISHCNSYSKFAPIIKKMKLTPEEIAGVMTTYMSDSFQKKYSKKKINSI